MAEPHDRKPILTIEQQIEHLKQKGVAFELCSEEEAADYLRDCACSRRSTRSCATPCSA